MAAKVCSQRQQLQMLLGSDQKKKLKKPKKLKQPDFEL